MPREGLLNSVTIFWSARGLATKTADGCSHTNWQTAIKNTALGNCVSPYTVHRNPGAPHVKHYVKEPGLVKLALKATRGALVVAGAGWNEVALEYRGE